VSKRSQLLSAHEHPRFENFFKKIPELLRDFAAPRDRESSRTVGNAHTEKEFHGAQAGDRPPRWPTRYIWAASFSSVEREREEGTMIVVLLMFSCLLLFVVSLVEPQQNPSL
jgi:hypothetical protein